MRFIDVLYFLPRLYSKGRVLGHKRGKRNSRPNTSLIQIEGVATKEDAQFYLGKVRSHCTVWTYNSYKFSWLELSAGCVCIPSEEGGAWNESSGDLGVCFLLFYTCGCTIYQPVDGCAVHTAIRGL